MSDCKIVAEIGCNHRGDVEACKRMIDIAAGCGVDYVKFQKRNNRELLTTQEYNAPHPCPENSYGSTYGAHREFLEFDIDTHAEMKTHCDRVGTGYACSVWDVTSTVEIASLCPDYLKIPSAMNLCYEIYEAIFESNFAGGIHVSLGMTTYSEIYRIVDMLRQLELLSRTVFYHCTSSYPAPLESLCLLNIKQLKEDFPGIVIGYSGHHQGITVDIAAQALGAVWIERHFTLNKQWKGTDHAASLEPQELRALVQGVRDVGKALRYKGGMLPDEEQQRRKLKKETLRARANA